MAKLLDLESMTLAFALFALSDLKSAKDRQQRTGQQADYKSAFS
ncbi:hypothetical protein [Pontibacter oryzae]|nr:hypothetical protein [Pontibacter oryzae]